MVNQRQKVWVEIIYIHILLVMIIEMYKHMEMRLHIFIDTTIHIMANIRIVLENMNIWIV